MVCKLVIVFAIVVVVSTAAPQLGYYHTSHEDHHETPAHYGFSYDVHDPHTGDIKTQHETRDGDVVRGEYSLLEPDGTIRTVKYIADEHNGFQAEVIRDPPKYPHEIYHE